MGRGRKRKGEFIPKPWINDSDSDQEPPVQAPPLQQPVQDHNQMPDLQPVQIPILQQPLQDQNQLVPDQVRGQDLGVHMEQDRDPIPNLQRENEDLHQVLQRELAEQLRVEDHLNQQHNQHLYDL